MAQDLIIIGAGGHGRVCAEVATRCGYAVRGFCDPAFALGEWINGVPIVAEDDERLLAEWTDAALLFVALGDNARRVGLGEQARRKGIALASLIDPSAVVSATAQIGAGSVVMAKVVVNANARVGDHAILNTACTVDHDCVLDAGAQIGPGANLAGGVTVGEGAMIGLGAALLPGVKIGRQAIVGAGAVVSRDVGEAITVVGMPARPIRH